MIITLTTPAMLFPAVSLLLLAYTNRFVTLASIIRTFDPKQEDDNTTEQIVNLRKRIYLIRRMQEAGVISFFLCVMSMLAIYVEYQQIGSYIFAASLVCLMYSLYLSVREITISCDALELHLKHFNADLKRKKSIRKIYKRTN
ncbi:DUF2721 domain-containing protein [Marinomonas posidonica]|uniref:DUF2721 domain-containing protein n=1 Tax=Marinomonas posidonica (strain CECT 7376 / NCIMB 14433 / IVIA-Po-181) TaxID=491952 RepID=F6CTD2_MARPP|nr:DUF2721 domain-containing protein [Marinomonas posidonica]AEF53981.1 hypothetical protein Mar181_0932 [Marinomonas posidonica IVIA-Po-181]